MMLMNRKLLNFLLVSLMSFLLAEENKSDDKNFIFSGSLSISNNGVAPVPSFTLGEPALINSVSITKGRLTFTPETGLDFSGNPWYIENWFRWQVLDSRFKINLGIDWSFFFENYYVPNAKVLEVQRYLALEIAGGYEIGENISALGKYWYNEGIGERTTDGHFVDFTLSINNIQLSDLFVIQIYPEIFYFNFTGNIDGLSIANKIEVSNHNFPVSFTSQVIYPLWTNMPDLGTELSFGLVFPLN